MVSGDGRAVEVHGMLLRVAGAVADGLVTQCRWWLAEGRFDEIGRALCHAVVSQRLALDEADHGLLGDLLADAGADPVALAAVEVANDDPLPMCDFASSRALADALLRGDEDAELAPFDLAVEPEDDVDRALVAAAQAAPGVVGVWRAWRFPVGGAPWPPPRRVYVVETDLAGDPVATTVLLQDALASAGEWDPQVEVYGSRAELPAYQRLARAYGGLLWSASEAVAPRLARLFDEVDEEAGPRMAAGHPTAADEELDRLVDYLRQGQPLLVTTARMDDVVDTSLTASVPMNFVTDGRWIWTDATTYYLERHRLLPDPDLVEHIRARGYRFAEVDGPAIHRALAVLQEPSTEEPAWSYG
jgi:hypothetical protein